ncbi:MAG: efflux RND transporter periplasmic adaptor subunit [Bacteroidia bacterium]|nr:efflux RND transporter periplasmic adaptor subunit [Bacteroidia bacterium]
MNNKLFNNHYSIIILSICLLIVSCKDSSAPKVGLIKTAKLTIEEKPKVEMMIIHGGVFYKEIICNGKLYAIRKADLKFRMSEIIEKINVKNGDIVEKDSIIAVLNNIFYNNQLQRALYGIEKSKIEFQDELMGRGYQFSDSTRVPPGIWKMCQIRSGYIDALFDLKSAEYNYQNTILKAPFRGIVCNLKSKEQNMTGSEIFCTLVDNTTFEAEFQVLESELRDISENQLVSVVPFALDTVAQMGVITEINPLVDENGLVTLKAKVTNNKNALFEGMNVRVLVRKAFPNRLVVPKQAVVMRSGKEVVFTLEGNLTKWNDVKISDENTTSYSIAEGLKPGMRVIISGNLNLGYNTEVEVINNERFK